MKRALPVRLVPAALGLAVLAASVPAAAQTAGAAAFGSGAPPAAPPRERGGGSPVAAAVRKRALVLIFPGVQIIDFTGPYEVLGAAGLRVETVAEKPGPLTTAMGLTVTPRHTLAQAPEAQVLVVPGGDVRDAEESSAVRAFLRERAARAEVVLSVCNGAFILARSGLLDGLSATTFAGLIDALKDAAPRTHVVSDQRYVDNGRIVTAAGLSSGIDGALHVVEKLYGKGTAHRVATNLEYAWDPAGTYVRAQLADRYLEDLNRRLASFDRETLVYEGTRERWESRFLVRTDSSPAELLAALQVAGRPTVSAGSARATWTFRGQDGAHWKGVATVAPAPAAEVRPEGGSRKGLSLTVRVEKG